MLPIHDKYVSFEQYNHHNPHASCGVLTILPDLWPQAAAPLWGRCRLICPEFTSRNFERRSIARVLVGSQSSELSGSSIEPWGHPFLEEMPRHIFLSLLMVCTALMFPFLVVSWVTVPVKIIQPPLHFRFIVKMYNFQVFAINKSHKNSFSG